MADFKDLADGQTDKWLGIFEQAGVKVDHNFPLGNHNAVATDMGLAKDPAEAEESLYTLSDIDSRKALCELMFYGVFFVLQENPLVFITDNDLNIEFKDLLEQATMYGLALPSGKIADL